MLLRKGWPHVPLFNANNGKFFPWVRLLVREMFGLMTAERANEIIIVTSGKFTREAIAFAEKPQTDTTDKRPIAACSGAVCSKSPQRFFAKTRNEN